MCALDTNYYQNKKQKLLEKQTKKINDHLMDDLEFAKDINEIGLEIQEIDKWIAENEEVEPKAGKNAKK